MRRLPALFCALILALFAAAPAPAADPENTLYLDVIWGRVVIHMRPDLAPKHVARIKQLVRQGFYDGLVFHRVLPGFMAQGGDPEGNGTGGSGQNLPAEFSAELFVRGALGMARGPGPNTADSQFFIVTKNAFHLNGKYTLWGEVVEGMDKVDRLAPGTPPATPDRIIRMQIASDVKETKKQ